MTKQSWLGLCAGFAVAALVTTTAHAQTPDAFKCQAGTSKAGSKFIGAKTKCVQKCEAGARKGKNPYSDCEPPFAGATAACVNDPVKGAETKAEAAILKACSKDCPDCYAGGDCSAYAPTAVADLEAQLDLFIPLVVCDPDSEAGDKNVDKCIDNTGKTLAKFAASKTKCYDKCISLEFKGKLPAGSCTPPTPSDVKTQECIAKAETKAAAAIDKACFATGFAPSCWAVDEGADWVALVEAAVDGAVPQTYCGSPSGAFLD